MTTLIIGALALALVQLVLLPASLNLNNIAYLISSRDESLELSVMQGRISRAGINFMESLPAFLALAILAVVQQIDLTQAAGIWLLLRVLYVPCYMFNIIYVRTVVWLGSLICLVYMATRLI